MKKDMCLICYLINYKDEDGRCSGCGNDFWKTVEIGKDKNNIMDLLGDCYTELRSLYEKFDDQMSDEDYELLVRIKEVLNKED